MIVGITEEEIQELDQDTVGDKRRHPVYTRISYSAFDD